ncbi:hypothetical protein [Puniceibacterium sp. IMCC21224]|uniref:hypothetical protein n=1 Tax=Puniceibacterium sp. IMCC21224 TaxID=1618204 RepID=UPI00064D88EA|nr:hypothetical protein [Puniceibacterium sp. IMCC21224]KMK68608.1 hypothetical protein IMCC21224_113491 [Puniceibacterium sp. IMCC21224]
MPLLLWIWHLDTRLTEIVLGSATFARGTTLALPGGMMAGESYRGFTFLPEAVWAVVFAVFGLAQLGAVVINGRWRAPRKSGRQERCSGSGPLGLSQGDLRLQVV